MYGDSEPCRLQRFDPRPHARGDIRSSLPSGRQAYYVSIHAPTRGATTRKGRREADRDIMVSIHAPTRGATGQGGRHAPNAAYWFRSTPPREGRPHSLTRFGYALGEWFRSHAPTRGATIEPSRLVERTRQSFRSTPPREGRLMTTSGATNRSGSSFDPRPHARGDLDEA